MLATTESRYMLYTDSLPRFDILIADSIKETLRAYQKVGAKYYMNWASEDNRISASRRAEMPYIFRDGRRVLPGVRKGGKMTPEEIDIINVNNNASQDIGLGQYPQSSGVDCSGFAWMCLENISSDLLRISRENFAGQIAGVKDEAGKTQHGITRTNADVLTSAENCLDVTSVWAILPGDLIRTSGGKHVIVVIEKDGNTINCAHSSDLTNINGPHEFAIEIISPDKDIFHQYWKEFPAVTTGLNTFMDLIWSNMKPGDGIKRTKLLQNKYDELLPNPFIGGLAK